MALSLRVTSGDTTAAMKPLEVLQSFSQHLPTLSGILQSRCEKNPGAEFLLFNKERQHSWKDFKAWVGTLSKKLKDENLSKDARIAWISANSDFGVALLFAVCDQGLSFVPLNPELSPVDLAYALNEAQSEMIYVSTDFQEKFPEVLALLNFRPTIKFIGAEDFTIEYGAPLENRAQPESIGLILYTSGTTGFPKGVMHSQNTMVLAGEAFVERMQLQSSDRMLCILPLFHINALFYSLMGAVAAGATLVLIPKFSASKFWTWAAELKVTQANIIAAIGKILTQRDRNEFRSHHVLKKIYGAPISIEIEKIFRGAFRVPVMIEGYGMTEIPGAINNIIGEKVKVGTMGVAARHPDHSRTFTELRVVDDEFQDVAPGDEGELLVKTPLMMKGYLKNDEATREAFAPGGWFKTGDLVRQDSDGFYIFVARKKDIIRKKGENIAGAELDRIAEKCEGVKEAAAIGVPSDLGEEDILLAIVKSEEAQLSLNEVHEHCKKHLAAFKVPRYIIFLEEFPHTPTARVAKHKLKKLIDVGKAKDFSIYDK